MKTIILADQHGFNGQEAAALTRLGFGNENLLGRVPCQLTLRQGNQAAVPSLVFPDEALEGQFFNLVKRDKEVLAFTTMPAAELARFYGKTFRDSQRTVSLDVAAAAEFASTTYANRMLRFRFVASQPVGIHLETSVVHQPPAAGGAGRYEVYLKPLVLTFPEHQLFAFYKSFFAGKSALPLALPPLTPDAGYASFGGGNGRYDLPALRGRLRQYFAGRPGFKAGDTLFFALWELVDQPAFREYLKEGAWFRLESSAGPAPAGTRPYRPFEADGGPLVRFCYPHDESNPAAAWRSDLLRARDDDPAPLRALRHAVAGDLGDALPGIRVQVEAYTGAAARDVFDWNPTISGPGGPDYARSPEGYWTEIRDFIDRTGDPDLIAFVRDVILDPGRAQGPVNPDHHATRGRFSDHLCPYPLQEKSRLAYAWLDCLIDFLRNDGVLHAPAAERDAYGVYLYDRHLSRPEMLRLRLSLPVDAEIRCRATNVLDHPNATLDANFILQ